MINVNKSQPKVFENSCNLLKGIHVHRGYYIAARRYELSLRVLKNYFTSAQFCVKSAAIAKPVA